MPNENPEKTYVAIIGDIVESKSVPDRGKIQERLRACLDRVNATCADDLASRFTLTLGDEFQGLLSHGRRAVDILEEIRQAMRPVRLRFGVGAGAVTTGIDPVTPLGSDGPAFHNAREMISSIKRDENRNAVARTDVRVRTGTGEEADRLLNVVFSLAFAIRSRWTARQHEITGDRMAHGGSQAMTAQRLGVTQSSVQKSLAGASYYAYQEAMAAAADALSRIGGRGGG